jgi:hypothetical protein
MVGQSVICWCVACVVGRWSSSSDEDDALFPAHLLSSHHQSGRDGRLQSPCNQAPAYTRRFQCNDDDDWPTQTKWKISYSFKNSADLPKLISWWVAAAATAFLPTHLRLLLFQQGAAVQLITEHKRTPTLRVTASKSLINSALSY